MLPNGFNQTQRDFPSLSMSLSTPRAPGQAVSGWKNNVRRNETIAATQRPYWVVLQE